MKSVRKALWNHNIKHQMQAMHLLKAKLQRFPTHNEYRAWCKFVRDYKPIVPITANELDWLWELAEGVVFVKCPFCYEYFLKKFAIKRDGKLFCSIWCEHKEKEFMQW